MYALIAFFQPVAALFGAKTEAGVLLNKVAAVSVEYEKAHQHIAKAKRKFERVKEAKISTFNGLKQRTLEKTQGACERLLGKIEEERSSVEDSYKTAVDKIEDKRFFVERLNRSVASIGENNHPF